MIISNNIINQVTVPVRASDYNFMRFFDSKLVGAVWCKTCLTQQRTDVSPISHISCGGDILTPALLRAQIVNSRAWLSIAMCSLLLKHVSAIGWGLGPGIFGPGSAYFSCQEAGLSESAGDGGSVVRPLLT